MSIKEIVLTESERQQISRIKSEMGDVIDNTVYLQEQKLSDKYTHDLRVILALKQITALKQIGM